MLFKPTRLSAFLFLFHYLGKQAQAQVNLGTASSFGVVASSALTNTGPTTVDGQIGISPADASSVTGFPPGTAIASEDVSSRAKQDAQVAYDAAGSLAPTRDITGQDLGGQLLVPGTYFASSSVGITGTLTLDGQNDPNAQFVFQIGSTLTTATSSAVVFTNGARACNVFWQIGSSATLGTGTTFTGSIIAQASITLLTGTTINGGLYALTGAVTLDTNQIMAPQECPQQSTGTTSLAAITTSLVSSSMSVPQPLGATLADTTTSFSSQQGASSGVSSNINSDGVTTLSESDTSTTRLGNTISTTRLVITISTTSLGNTIRTTGLGNTINTFPSSNTIRKDSSEMSTGTILSRDETTNTISRSTQSTASVETDLSSMRSNVYSTTINTRTIRSTATDSRRNNMTLSLKTESSNAQPTTESTVKSLEYNSSKTSQSTTATLSLETKSSKVQSTMSTSKQGSKSDHYFTATTNMLSSTGSTYWKASTTPTNLAITASTKDKLSTKTNTTQYAITTASNNKITTINGTPCTTISYYDLTCSCTTTTVVPLAFTPAPSPELSVITVNGVPCTTTRFYESECDCIRTSNIPLHVITASASVATVVNGVPYVTSKYYETACDCVRVTTVPVQIMSTAPTSLPVPESEGELGMVATACAQTGIPLFACMSACMESYMPIATKTILASNSCSATPRYRM